MSLQPQTRYIVPAETAKVARAVFREGNLCLTIAGILGEFLGDRDRISLFPSPYPCVTFYLTKKGIDAVKIEPGFKRM